MLGKYVKAIGLALAAFAVMAPAAFAAGGGDTSATVIAGQLTLNGAAVTTPFPDSHITGVVQHPVADLDVFTAADLRGTGAGWHVTAQAQQFTGENGHPLALGSLSMSAPTVQAHTGTTSAAPTLTAGPYTIDVASARQIASAALGEGMGTYDFSATELTLTLPGDVYADTYSSTVTIDVITAP